MRSKRGKREEYYELGEIIRETVEKLGIKKRLEEVRVFEVWEEAVGLRVAANAQPHRIKNGKLFVSTVNPIWAQELSLLSENIREKLNECLGDEKIKEIYFQCTSGIVRAAKKEKKTSFSGEVRLSPAEMKEIVVATKNIGDETLREAVKKVIVRDKKCKKQRPLR